MGEPSKYKLQVNPNSARAPNPLTNVDIAENLGTGRTGITSRKKECEKYLREQRRRRSRSYSDDSRDHKYIHP